MGACSRHQGPPPKVTFAWLAATALACRDVRSLGPIRGAGGAEASSTGGRAVGTAAGGGEVPAGGHPGVGEGDRPAGGLDRGRVEGGAAGLGDGGEPAGSKTDGGEGGVRREPPPPATAPFETIDCRTLETGQCRVEGSGELVLRGEIVTAGAVYRGGEVRLRGDGTIACTGCDCTRGDPVRTVTCSASVIAPGLVNPHDHVAYAHQAPRPPSTERYEHRHDWRLGLRGHAAIPYEGGAPTIVRAAHELRMLLGGATTIAGGAGHRGFLRNPDVSGLGEGLPTAPADSDTFPLADSDGRFVTIGCSYGAGYTTSDDVERFGGHLPHLAEGVDAAAANELRCALGAALDLIRPSSAVVHAVAADAETAAGLGTRGALVVWSPRSNVSLYGNTAPIPLLRRSGVEVALGTDWLLSGSMNVLREFSCARELGRAYFDGAFADHDLVRMATASAARAVGAASALGRLAPGFLGDVIVIRRRELEPHTALVTAGPADVELVLRGGVPLYGRAVLIDALAEPGCEPLDVCGEAQRVCARDAGVALDELVAAADATYPLFFCDTPVHEPTCVPARPGEYDGIPSERDADGDGLEDPNDSCPRTFDPLRPLDAGVPSDADGDGLGDACDPCPLDADRDCVEAPSNDRDRDGVPDTRDLCPFVPERAASDNDGDGIGDACDPCASPNPGVTACPLPVAALRDVEHPEHPPRHARVEVAGVTVTALRPDTGSARGYHVQGSLEPFSGLFVFTGSTSPGVAAGDRLTLRGRTDLYYGTDQLVAPEIIARYDAGAPPEPIDARPNTVGDQGDLALAYDSMLVSISDVVVVNENPDAPADYDETLLDGALRLDDVLYPEFDNTLPAGTRFSRISGILGRSFDHQKLWPRGASDLEP